MSFDLNNLGSICKENSHIEFKSAQNGLPNSIWETYSAFANTDGGEIILGVSEYTETGNLKVSGVGNPEHIKKVFWDTINNPTKVSNNILRDSDFSEIVLDGRKTIFIIHVPSARIELKPIYIDNDILKGTYKRNHEGDYHCTKEEISAMLRDAYPSSYDLKVLDNFHMEDLNAETIRTYRRYHEVYKPNHPWGKLDDEKYLMMIGAAGISENDNEIHPTLAGLLMFSNATMIMAVCSGYFLDYRENLDPGRIRWTDRMQSESGDWSGNVFDFFMEVSRKIVHDFKVPFQLKNMQRVDNTPLHEAAREALINCLANADYFGIGGVVIKKNVDSIVYENPGSIRVGKKQMLQGGVSDPRNKNIMKMFNLIGYGEKAGSGFPGIIDASRSYGFAMPTIEENRELDRTSVTMWLTNNPAVDSDDDSASKTSLIDLDNEIGDKKSAIKAGVKKSAIKIGDKKTIEAQRVEEICHYMAGKNELSTNEIADAIGLGLSRTRELLNKLVANGEVSATGPNKTRRYKLK